MHLSVAVWAKRYGVLYRVRTTLSQPDDMVRRNARITVCPGEGRRALVRRLRTIGLEQESDNLVFRQPPLASNLLAGVRL